LGTNNGSYEYIKYENKCIVQVRILTVLVDFDNEEERCRDTKEEDAWQDIHDKIHEANLLKTRTNNDVRRITYRMMISTTLLI
jgi:di/tripeptidase